MAKWLECSAWGTHGKREKWETGDTGDTRKSGTHGEQETGEKGETGDRVDFADLDRDQTFKKLLKLKL